jgi:hypothetical protein
MSSFSSPQNHSTTNFFLSDAIYPGITWNLAQLAVNISFVLPNAGFDLGANITLLENGTIQLNFADPGSNFPYILPVLSQLLVPNVTRGFVSCSYPLSGQYDHLPRILFYVASIVALLGRKLTWVAEAALGIIMSYAAVSAIHLFVLLGLYKFSQPFLAEPNPDTSVFYGDVDFWGIAPIVTLSVILLTPMLSWSSTFRSHKAKILLQSWAVLMFAAFIPIMVLIRRWYDANNGWYIDELTSVAYCKSTDASCQPTLNAVDLPAFLYKDQYDRCGCIDFCGLLQPTAPLRSGTGMVAILQYRYLDKINTGKLFVLMVVLYIFWIIACIQGGLALMHSNSTPEAARNRLFRVCNTDLCGVVSFCFKGARRDRILKKLHLQKQRDSSTVYRRIRRLMARIPATAYYLLSLFGLVLYPFMFVLNLVIGEILVSTVPNSERSSSLGAWSPWAGGGLVVLSAVILGVYPHVSNSTTRLVSHIQYGKEDRPGQDQQHEGIFENASYMLGSFGVHMAYKLRILKWSARFRYREFVGWLKDPETRSYPGSWAVDDENMPSSPRCACSKCAEKTSTL